jgi:hypothetical protein
MKRRVFSKTTSFHTFYQKKKGRGLNGDVLNDTVPLSSSPRTCSGEEGKRSFCLNFVGPSLAWSPPTNARPHAVGPPTKDTGRPPAARLPKKKPGEPNLGSSTQWPTSRRETRSHAPQWTATITCSINSTQQRKKRGGGERPERERTERREKKGRKKKEPKRERKSQRERRTNQREERTNQRGGRNEKRREPGWERVNRNKENH